MGDISNETLMALADDELNPIERARVAAIVAARPDLQARLAAFTATGRVLAPQFRKPLDEPLPRHLVDLVLAANAPSKAIVGQSGILNKLKLGLRVELPRWPSALAYSAVLLLGVAAGWYLRHASKDLVPSTLDDGRIMVSGGLARSLEETPSGAAVSLGSKENPRSDSILRIRLTFKTANGYCRHYELTRLGGGFSEGIACRHSDGRWELKTHASINRGPVSGDKVKPAAGNSAELLTAAVDRTIEGDAFTLEEEAALIARKWNR